MQLFRPDAGQPKDDRGGGETRWRSGAAAEWRGGGETRRR
jgi:hypothetical protein